MKAGQLKRMSVFLRMWCNLEQKVVVTASIKQGKTIWVSRPKCKVHTWPAHGYCKSTQIRTGVWFHQEYFITVAEAALRGCSDHEGQMVWKHFLILLTEGCRALWCCKRVSILILSSWDLPASWHSPRRKMIKLADRVGELFLHCIASVYRGAFTDCKVFPYKKRKHLKIHLVWEYYNYYLLGKCPFSISITNSCHCYVKWNCSVSGIKSI